jgi:hypothetical protein
MEILIPLLFVIGLVTVIAFIASRYLLINTKDSVVNHQRYLGNHSNPADIYGHPSTGLLYSPLNIEVTPMDKLILIDIADDPEYGSIELQIFDDRRGQGARVLLYRKDGPADFYYTSQVFAEPAESNTAVIIPDMQYRLDVTTFGLDAGLKMKDREGKSIEFQLKESSIKKEAKGFLAPVGGGTAITFDYFPFFHMKGMKFVRRSGSKITISIDGEHRTPQEIPIPVNWEFVYLSRYSTDPIIGCWNRTYDGELFPMRPEQQSTYQDEQALYELVNNVGHYEIHRMIGFSDGHNVSLEFSPPIPNLPNLRDGINLSGHFSAGADEVLGIGAGEYYIERHGDTIEMKILPLKGWQPMPGKIWVKTWIWQSTITIDINNTVCMKSEWIRKK